MAIYTRTGDQGETDLLGDGRVPKDALQIEVCGELDELDAWLGLVRCEPLPEGVDSLLEQLQRRMVKLRAAVAATEPASAEAAIPEEDVDLIEWEIDRYEAKLEPLDTFILPAGGRAASLLHVARAVCRRAERRLVTLARAEPEIVAPTTLAYVNRLSDLLFILARAANANEGLSDAPC